MGDSPTRRVLFISTRTAWPVDAGYAVRTYGLLMACVANGECEFALVTPDGTATELPPTLVGRCRQRLVAVRRNSAPGTIIRWVFGRQPWSWSRIAWQGASDELARLISTGNFDEILVSGIDGWRALPRQFQHLVTLDFDDVESFKLTHRLERSSDAYHGVSGVVRKVRDLVDLRRWNRIEGLVLSRARQAIVCSESDRLALGRDNVHSVPNTFSPAVIELPGRKIDRHRSVLSFVGSLTTPPNREASHFLVGSIMPLIWARRPDVTVRLVGRPSKDVARLDRPPQVVVTGFVDDLADELARADVVVAPFLSGGGTRIKILEAFYLGIPVVSTTVGAEGIGAVHGEQILIADSPEAFADACITLLDDHEMAARLTAAATTLAEAHSQPAINDALRNAFEGS